MFGAQAELAMDIERKAFRLLAWIATIPVGILGLALGVLAGVVVDAAGDGLCPTRYLGRSGCWGPLAPCIHWATLTAGGGIAGFLFVALPAWMGPAPKRPGAIAMFVLLVSLFAGLLCFPPGMPPDFRPAHLLQGLVEGSPFLVAGAFALRRFAKR